MPDSQVRGLVTMLTQSFTPILALMAFSSPVEVLLPGSGTKMARKMTAMTPSTA